MIGLLLVGTLELAPPVSANAVPTTDALNVSAAGGNGGSGRVAFDPSGNAILVWIRIDSNGDNRVELRLRSPYGSLGTTQTLSASGGDAAEPQIAVDATGDAVIAWRRWDGSNYRIQAIRRAASGTLSTVKTLSAAGQDAGQQQVAVDPDGNAYVVWLRSDGSDDRVQLRRRSVDGTLGEIESTSGAGQDAAAPQVAVDGNGNAFVTWSRFDGSHTRIQLRRRSAGGTLGTTSTISDAGQNALLPQLAIDPARNVYVAWQRSDGSHSRVQLRQRAPDGVMGPSFTLSAAGQNAGNAAIAASAGGAVVTWDRFDGAFRRIQAFRQDASGAHSSVVTLSEAGAEAVGAQVAMDAVGNAFVAWQRYDGANTRVQVARRSAGGTVGAVSTMSAAGQNGGLSDVSTDLKGNALVAWSRSDGSNPRVQAGYVVQYEALSEPGVLAGPSEIAVDTSGNALIAWWRQPYMDARRRAANGAIGALKHLNGGVAAAQNQHVAFDADGNAFITWIEWDGANDLRVKLVRRSASGTYGTTQTLSAAGESAHEPQIAIDASGRVLVVWRRFDGSNYRIQLRRRSPSGTLSETQTLSSAGQDAPSPAIAVDKTGNAVVTWQRFDGSNYRIQLRRRSASGTLGTTSTLSAAGESASASRIAMDSAGNAVIIWNRFDGPHTRVQAVRRSAGGTLSSVKTLSPAGQHAANAELAVDPDGNALVVWSRSDGANTRIELIRRTPSGTLSTVQAISAAGQNADVPAIVVDSSGRAVIAWTRFDGTSRRLQALRRSAGGTLGPVQTLSAPGENAGETTYNGPKIASTPGGKTVVITWYRSNGGSSVVHVLRF